MKDRVRELKDATVRVSMQCNYSSSCRTYMCKKHHLPLPSLGSESSRVRAVPFRVQSNRTSHTKVLFNNYADIVDFAGRVFQKLGMNEEDSQLVGSLLVQADLRGQEGHGVSRIPIYTKRLKMGLVDPNPEIKITEISGSCSIVDGGTGMGFIVATMAMKHAIEKAQTTGGGIGLVGVRNSTHFGGTVHVIET